MVQWRLKWTPSSSSFAVTRDVVAKINGSQSILISGMAINATNFVGTFDLNATVEWWTVVYGDNSTASESVHRTFTAGNLEQVQPDTLTGEEFVGIIP
jgi:hypothetical protein